MNNSDTKDLLYEYLPSNAVAFAIGLINKHDVVFEITPERRRIKGVYYKPQIANGYRHEIKIDGSVPKYNFLITFLHEFAHLYNRLKYKNGVKSHGAEWKNEFKNLLLEAIELGLFPEKIKNGIINQYIRKKRWPYRPNTALKHILREFNTNTKQVFVLDLPINTKFWLKSGGGFKKGKKLRVNYSCTELISGDKYKIHGFAEVVRYELSTNDKQHEKEISASEEVPEEVPAKVLEIDKIVAKSNVPDAARKDNLFNNDIFEINSDDTSLFDKAKQFFGSVVDAFDNEEYEGQSANTNSFSDETIFDDVFFKENISSVQNVSDLLEVNTTTTSTEISTKTTIINGVRNTIKTTKITKIVNGETVSTETTEIIN